MSSLSGFWSTPLLILALILLIFDVLILIAFLFWIVSKIIKDKKTLRDQAKHMIISTEEKPSIEWTRSNTFKIPRLEPQNHSNHGSHSSTPTMHHTPTSINPQDLDTSLYTAIQPYEAETASEDTIPSLTFALYHYQESQQLVVSLIKGSGISLNSEKAEPQITISIILLNDSQIHQSLASKGPSPMFNEDFYFTIPMAQLTSTQIKFNIWIVDRYTRKVPFGEVIVRIAQVIADRGMIATEGTGHLVYNITRKNKLTSETTKGEILLSLCHLPAAERLNIVIMKARDIGDLEEQDRDLYVKVSAIMNSKVVKHKKIQSKKKSTSPVFNEATSFHVSTQGELNPDQMGIVVSLYASRPLGPRKRLIGRVIFGYVDGVTSEGAEHWQQMLNSPRSAIAKWQELM